MPKIPPTSRAEFRIFVINSFVRTGRIAALYAAYGCFYFWGEYLRTLPNLRPDSAQLREQTNHTIHSFKIGRDGRIFISARRLDSMSNSRIVRETSTSSNHDQIAVKIEVHDSGGSFFSYHTYKGGNEFRPVLPRDQSAPGEDVIISLEQLSRESFVSGIPSFELENRRNVRWAADRVVLESFAIADDKIRIEVVQDHPLANLSYFTMTGIIDAYPGVSNQHGGVYLQFKLADYIGRVWKMRIRHDGLNPPQIQINRGAGCESVSLLSFDGFRLRVHYGRQSAVSTCYAKPPSEELYGLVQPRSYSGRHLNLVQGKCSYAMIVDSVILHRELEGTMLREGSVYDQGRIGSEIAYLCGAKYLGLRKLVIEEPSRGGKDLYSTDAQVAIQTRMISTRRRRDFGLCIQEELLKLTRKLRQDFKYNPWMARGYAILSFVDYDEVIRTLLLEVPRP